MMVGELEERLLDAIKTMCFDWSSLIYAIHEISPKITLCLSIHICYQIPEIVWLYTTFVVTDLVLGGAIMYYHVFLICSEGLGKLTKASRRRSSEMFESKVK